MSRAKTVAIFTDRHHIAVSVFNDQSCRIQCSAQKGLCRLAYPPIRATIAGCGTMLTNNIGHQLFRGIDLEQVAVHSVQEKLLEYEAIEPSLLLISAHQSQNSNIRAYFRQMTLNPAKFKALGMLLGHLLTMNSQKLFLEDIDYFVDTLYQVVECGQKELEFLEISKEDLHPSHIKRNQNNKQGYSVISAYQSFLASTASKRILRHLLLNPTFNLDTLRQRHQLLAWMKMHLKEASHSKHFRRVCVLETLLTKFGRMSVEEDEWRKLIKTMEAMIEMRKALMVEHGPPLIDRYVNSQYWEETLELFSIFKETLELNPRGVRKGVDRTLDDLKRTYDNMPHLLTLIAREQGWQFEFKIVFMAQVGYLVKVSHSTPLPQADTKEWTLQFSNREDHFYSTPLTEGLDNEYGDLFGEIQDIEKKIIFEMENLIMERESRLLELYWQLCQIECYWGISQLSKNMCEPRLSSEALVVSQGWHLLLTGDVIHNHSFSFPQTQAPVRSVYNSELNLVNTGYTNRCAVITGPNASGKTVYMKQLGLMVYLTHCGFFVPASVAEIPLVDSIHFVGTSQSIYRGDTCGFEEELASLSSIAMTNIISNKSLVMIDELGSEVDYDNALKLLYNTVDYLTNKKTSFALNRSLARSSDQFSTPLVVIVTHLSQILSSNALEENYLIRFLTMMVEEEGLRLFKVRPGLVKKGYGIKAASCILAETSIRLSNKYLALMLQL